MEAVMTDAMGALHTAPKMLIADDDPDILRLLAERCKALGFEVETARNGIKALIVARRSHPDILILDVNMPEADGLSVCVRLLESVGNSAAVVVITGSTDPDTIHRCESLGAFYVRKGPEFWKALASALSVIFPHMADRVQELEKRSKDGGVRKRPRVLLVDDDPEVEMFLSSRLAKFGVDMLYAADGVQGYQIACKSAPGAIICDYSMTNGGAQYLLARLRSTPGTENIPFFVISGRQLDALTKETLKRRICGYPGAASIFQKSFDVDELFGALQKVCGFERRRAEDRL
jgi:CheY-like chemotaxis protein